MRIFIKKVGRLLKIVGDFFKMLAEKIKKRPKRKIYLQKNFWLYLLIMVLAIVFTQALVSPISTVIFVFLLLIPIVSVLHIVAGVFFLRLYLETSETETQKGSPVQFSLSLANESFIPFPFVDAEITVPREDAVRCDKVLTRMSLVPFGGYCIRRNLSFTYRGNYDIGVSDLYCSDMFRMFKYRSDVNIFTQIFVMPRQLALPTRPNMDTSDELTVTTSRLAGQDNTEMSDIREYRRGDSLRSVHWKLSSKSDELIVREYARNAKQQMIIFCDTSKRYADNDKRFEADVNELACDAVVEAALALARENLVEGRATTLVWFDNRINGEVGVSKITSQYEFEQIYRLFATAPIVETAERVYDLTKYVSENGAAEYIYVTGCLDTQTVAGITSASGARADSAGNNSVSVWGYVPYQKVLPEHKEKLADLINACCFELSKCGISYVNADLDVYKTDKFRYEGDEDEEEDSDKSDDSDKSENSKKSKRSDAKDKKGAVN